ncbi:hypothetical protein U952_02588 [Staphylococcus aureus 87807-12]|nr:hypothetical protein U952_02588 [Staphylococcus aureus 87807-12]
MKALGLYIFGKNEILEIEKASFFEEVYVKF